MALPITVIIAVLKIIPEFKCLRSSFSYADEFCGSRIQEEHSGGGLSLFQHVWGLFWEG